LSHPQELTVGPDGNIYVSDASQSVAVISPEGNVLRRWGKPGNGPGEFAFIDVNDATDLTQDLHGYLAVGPGGRVYVSDPGNYRVQVFSATGGFIRQFDRPGEHPATLVVDADGNVYLAADPEGGISKISPTGELVWRIAGQSITDPDFAACCYLRSIDAHGRIVGGNGDHGKVLYLDARGRKIDVFDAPELCDVTVDGSGNIFVGTQCNSPGDTLVFDRNHTLVGRWDRSSNPLKNAPVAAPNGEAFAVGLDGTILRLRVALPRG